jgi:hypothetical protein
MFLCLPESPVVDPHLVCLSHRLRIRIYFDPDPAFHFNVNPDPAFHFDAGQDPVFHFDLVTYPAAHAASKFSF